MSIFSSRAHFPQETFSAPAGGTVTISFIHHASIAISYNGTLIQVDPVMKLGEETADYNKFKKADFILITHHHYDHLSMTTIEEIRGKKTSIILDPTSFEELEEGTVIRNGESLTLSKDISLEAVPAYNITEDRLQFHPKGRDNGYILTVGGLRIYISGDTEDIPELASLKDIDVAFLSANQPFTMTPEQCVRAAGMFSPKVLIPYHLSDTDTSLIAEGLADSGIDVRLHPELK